jgi:hypothetical protein
MTEAPKRKRKQKDAKESLQVVLKLIVHPNIQNPKRKKTDSEGDEDFVVRWQNPALQADLVVEKLRTLNPNLSSIELGELLIPGTLH